MAGFTVDTSGLMGCQRAIASEASQFGGLAGTLRQNQVRASDFGSLPSSGTGKFQVGY